MIALPPTNKSFCIPTPPLTINAPVVLFVALVGFVMLIALVVEFPLSVTDCRLLVFHIVTSPDCVETAVSVPANTLATPYCDRFSSVNTNPPLE